MKKTNKLIAVFAIALLILAVGSLAFYCRGTNEKMLNAGRLLIGAAPADVIAKLGEPTYRLDEQHWHYIIKDDACLRTPMKFDDILVVEFNAEHRVVHT